MARIGSRIAAATAWCCLATTVGWGCGGSSPAAPQEVIVTIAAPAGFAATAGDGKVTLTWQLVADATAYNLYWANAPGVTKGGATRIPDVTPPFEHGPLPNGAAVYYVVTALGPGGESPESEERSATPRADTPPCSVPAPPAAAASAAYSASGVPQFTVTWQPVAGATAYDLYWGTQPDALRLSGTRVPNATSPYVHGGLATDAPYFYVVTAANACGEGEPSAPVGGRSPGASLAAPARLEVQCTPHVGPSWTYDVSWPPVPLASSYEVSAVTQIVSGSTEYLGATDTTAMAVTVDDCITHTVAIPGAHTAYVQFAVFASACAPDVPCSIESPEQQSAVLSRCVERPTMVGWDRATRTLRWAPAAGATVYWIQVADCADAWLYTLSSSCTATECAAGLPASCAGSPSAQVVAAACSAAPSYGPEAPSEPFPLDW